MGPHSCKDLPQGRTMAGSSKQMINGDKDLNRVLPLGEVPCKSLDSLPAVKIISFLVFSQF